MAPPQQRPSQAVSALLRLRQLLLDGEYPAGAHLRELELVERLGVSRTPVRHALATLAFEGLLEAHGRNGYKVRTFTMQDIADAIELRGALEGIAARLAAERGAPSGELWEIVAELDAVVGGDTGARFERYVQLNQRFHRLLQAMAQSPMLDRSLGQVLSLPFASPSAFVLAESELPQAKDILIIGQHQHRRIAQAIENRHGARAEAVAREHALLALDNLNLAIERRELLADVPGAAFLDLTR